MSAEPRPDGRLNVMLMTDVTGRGGAEKALVDLALRLDRDRFNVLVCATRTAGNYQPLLDQAGVRSVILKRHSRREVYKLAGLVRLLRREPVHVLHTHLFGSNTWGRVLGRLAGVPVVIAHEHWSSKDRREVWVDRLLYRLSDRILVPSEASKRQVMEMEGIPARYLEVLYNGVDPTLFSPQGDRPEVRRELGVAPDALLVGTVGRLSPEKGGVDLLIRAVASLRARRPEAGVRLVVVGDGPLRPHLERVAAEVGEPVVFTGVRADVARLLGAMDVFVLPSLMEALPIALLEAMSAGLPVIATRVGGVPEILQHEATGLLVPPGDEAALGSALERLACDLIQRRRLARAGREHVNADFTIDRMVSRVERLYERLAHRTMRGRCYPSRRSSVKGVQGRSPAGVTGVSPGSPPLPVQGVQGRSPAGVAGVSPGSPPLRVQGVQGRSPAGVAGVSPGSPPFSLVEVARRVTTTQDTKDR